MNRFIQADRPPMLPTQAGRAIHDSARLIRQNIAEHIFRENDVELGGLQNERHGRRVHVLVRKVNIGKIAADASDTSRHRREHSSTFALSTESTACAALRKLNATRAIRSISGSP